MGIVLGPFDMGDCLAWGPYPNEQSGEENLQLGHL